MYLDLIKRDNMSTYELELFEIISKCDDPEKAVFTAIEVFTAFLAQLSEDREQPVAGLPESF